REANQPCWRRTRSVRLSSWRPLPTVKARVAITAPSREVNKVSVRDDVGLRSGRWCKRARHGLLDGLRLLLEKLLRVVEDEGLAKHLVHVVDEANRYRSQHSWWDLLDVLLVLRRDENALDPSAVCRQHFFFQSSDGEDAAAQRHLTGHRQVV